MRLRRLAILVLGGWIGATILMMWVAVSSLPVVESASRSRNPAVQVHVRQFGLERGAQLMRYQVAELKRHYFESWEVTQLWLGGVLVLMLLFATDGNAFVMLLAVLMWAEVFVQHWTVGLKVVELGRALDFTSVEDLLPERQAFWSLHRAYSIMEMAKVALGIVLGIRLSMSSHQTVSLEPRRKRRKRRHRDRHDSEAPVEDGKSTV